MKRTFSWKSLAVLGAALGLIAIIALTPGGQEFLSSVTERMGAAAAGAGDRYELTIVLAYDAGGSFEWRGMLTRDEYQQIEFFPKELREKYLTEARRALARKQGYFDAVYSDEGSRLTATRVSSIKVTDLRTSRETFLPLR